MKYLFLLSFFSIIKCTNLFSQTITIDAFQDATFQNFGDGSDITAEVVKSPGFKFQIVKEAGIEKAQIKSEANPEFNDVAIGVPASISIGMVYMIKDPFVTDDKILIKIIKNGEFRIITLIVSKAPPPIKCIPKEPEKKDCPANMDFEHKFGEDVLRYRKNTIVYIYDFNKDPSKRGFYKVVKKENVLKASVANFNNETLRPKNRLSFKVLNINRFMYDVAIADSVIHFDSEPSALFTRMFLGDSTLLGSLMNTFTSNSTKIQSAEGDVINRIKENLSCFVQKYNWLQNKMLDAYDPCGTFFCCYSIDYLDLANNLASIRTDAVTLQTSLEKKKKIVTDNEKKISDCDVNDKAIAANKASIEAFKKLSATEQENKKEELNALNKTKADLDEKAKDCTKEKKEGYQSSIDGTNKELLDFTAINNLLTNLPSDKEIKRVIVFLRNMVIQNQTYLKDYIPLNGNKLDLKISIASKDSIFKYFSIPEYKNDPIRIEIPILWNPFVSFSSGSFVGLGKNLLNKTYTWQAKTGNNNTIDSSKYTLVEKGYTLPPMGFAALGSVEWKASNSFGIGVSVGVGLTIESTPRLAYLAGGSLFFGELRQFAITGGFVGMQVNKLSNNFQEITDNQVIYRSNPNVEYYKELKVGGFISLTYTLFKASKSK